MNGSAVFVANDEMDIEYIYFFCKRVNGIDPLRVPFCQETLSNDVRKYFKTY